MNSFESLMNKFEYFCSMGLFDTMSVTEALEAHIIYIESLRMSRDLFVKRLAGVTAIKELDDYREEVEKFEENEKDLIDNVNIIIMRAIEAFELKCEAIKDLYIRNIGGFKDSLEEAEKDGFNFLASITEVSELVKKMEV